MTLVVFPKNYDIAADCDGNLVVGKDTSDVKGFHLYRDINGHSPEFRVESNQTAVGSYLSVKRASISSATTHAAVRFLNAAGATEWQIGTRAADNSFKIAYSSDGSSFTDIVTVTTAGAMTYGGDITLSTTSKLQFRDTGIYINSGADGKITISADGTGADDITLAGTVEVSGASITPATTDQSALGTTSKMWSDLFLASAGVINFNNGNVTITHAAGVLTVDGAAMVFNEASADLDFRVESNGMAYGVYLDGGKDALVLGSNTDTSSADQLITVSRAARTATAATNYYDLIIAPAGAVTVPAGVTAIVSTARFNEPNITATGTVTLAATIYVSGQPSEGSQNVGLALAVDTSIGLGAAGQARMLWESADADSNQLVLQLPAAGATDSPVIVIGQAVENVDMGAAATGVDYSAVVDPRIALFSSGAVTTGPVIEFRKARGTTAAPTVCTSGDDIGTIDFYGAVANGEYVRSASIRADIAGTIATTRGPGTLTFLTATNDAPSVLTAALTLGADQSATIATGLTLTTGSLLMASGMSISFDGGSVTITHSAGALAFAGAAVTFSGNVTVADDGLLAVGTGSTARLSWDTTDADSNQLLLQLPAAGAVDSPVLIVGQSIESIDFGAAAAGADYSGIVDPRIAIFSSGAVTTAPVLEFRKSRGTVAAPTVCTSGDDLGTLDFYGAVANGEYVRAASIRADMAGTIATTRGPGTLTFLTATDAPPSVLTAALTLGADQSATFGGVINLPSGASINGTVSITVNNDSADVDFIVESNGNANMFTVDAGLDAIGIGGVAVTSQTLTITNAALNATAGRILKLSGSVEAPNFGDGYGALEVDITFSGTVAGTSAASSTWVNIAASAVPGANIITPRNDGIWLASGITATNAIMVIGGRLQYVPNDGADCSNIHLFDTNIYSNVLKSLFRVNAIADMGGSTGAQAGNDYKVPLFYDVTAGQLWYVNVYHT